ncbi:ribbon-helix-helix protein, CopG family [Bradyrhizobium elkanii]
MLAKKIGMAEAALVLSRESGLSLRQAYRYLEVAKSRERLLPAPQPSVTLSLKMPADLAQKLQTHATASRLSASEVMRRARSRPARGCRCRAVAAYLASVREDG